MIYLNVVIFFKFTLFADDCTATCVLENMEGESVARTVENKLIPLNSWLTKNKLAVNHSKTHFIFIS